MENQDMTKKTEAQELSFAEIYGFLRKNARKILWMAAFSFAIVFFVIIAVYCFVPRERGYQTSISLTLPFNKGHYSYPSGKRFSNADLISRPVLRKVYNDLGLEKQVSFEDFSKSFFIAQTSMKKALLDAQFKAKMNVRNINVVQLGQLEREYQEAITATQSSLVTIAMKPEFSVNARMATRILTAIPDAWFDIYSVQEAKVYPAPVPIQQIQGLAKEIGQEGQLILLEKSRLYCRQLLSMCVFLNEMLQGRNIVLSSGETLGDLQNRLNMVERYQINMLQMYVLEHPEYYGAFDKVFLESRVKNIEYDLLRMKGKYDGVISAMNALVSDGVGVQNSAVAARDHKITASSGNASASVAPVTLQLDAGFFASIAQLIRNDINSDLRRILAEKTMLYRDEWAELEAELARYQEILDVLRGKKTSRSHVIISRDKFFGMMREMIGELFMLSDKVKQYRERLLREEHTSRQFCTREAEVQSYSVPLLPLSRVVLGMIALWVLVNLGMVFFMFQTRNKA